MEENLIDRDIAEDYFGSSDWEILAKETLREVPLVDAVPVVRCARCRHGEAFKTFPGGIFCPYIKDTVPPDGYCYMGEENTYD